MTSCNHVHVIKGKCLLEYGHTGEHQWEYPDRERETAKPKLSERMRERTKAVGVDLGNNESVASSFIASLEARRRELEQELAEVKSALDAAKSVRASRMGANASGASIEGPKA